MKEVKLYVNKEDINTIDYLKTLFNTDAKIQYDILMNSSVVFKVNILDSYTNVFYKFIAKVIVTNAKFDFFSKRLNIDSYTYEKVALLASLIFFAIKSEVNEVYKKIKNLSSINIDGVINFCLVGLYSDWEDLLEVVELILCGDMTSSDINNVISFIMASKQASKKSLFLAEFPELLITNVTDGVITTNVKFFHNSEYDLISLIVEECPLEFIVEDGVLSKDLLKVLSKFTDIKVL